MSAENERTTRLSGSGGPVPNPSDDPEYSATVLASHWIQQHAGNGTLVEDTASCPPPAPDRVDGTVMRFGPGVTAVLAHRTHGTLAPVPAPTPPRRRRAWRRHVLPAVVLLCVLAFLAWQRIGPPVEVESVKVRAQPGVLGCGDTADIVGVVRTNGRPGTLTYRWTRSDGTSSEVLREVMVRGQKEARLHLKWTFQGEGSRAARAELRLLTPTERTVSARFTYDCS